MYSGQLTPPSSDWLEGDFSAAINYFNTDGAFPTTATTTYASQWTPVPMTTPSETPPRSPQIFGGPRLIPKVRKQDQTVEPAAGPTRHRSHSTGHTTNLPQKTPSSNVFARSFDPSTYMQTMSPVSNASPSSSTFGPELTVPCTTTPSRRPGATHGRSISASAIPRHARHSSGSNDIDSFILTRYGFPTYRNIPGGAPGDTPQIPTALNFLTPMSMPGSVSSVASIPSTRQGTPARPTTPAVLVSPAQPASPTPSRLPAELVYDPTKQNVPMSTLIDYLTAPNPSPSLVQRIVQPPRGQSSHFWFDVRNLRSWSDFNMTTIAKTPSLLELLQCEIPASALPIPSRLNRTPDFPSQLHELVRDHYAIKVNAALSVSLGTTSMTMRSLHTTGPTTGQRSQPEFLSNYSTDAERCVTAERGRRGRVVGIVMCYEAWNSGMRAATPVEHCRYLAGLAHLHRFMRDHGSRYGFIVTEIELVCVRFGGACVPDAPGRAPVPNFGFLELSTPIQVSTYGKASGHGEPQQLTAAMALWYLHMLAKEEPLPGQPHWKLDVSGAAACTRKKHLTRDAWMPKPNISEVREARRNRGWVWPHEPLNKRECGRVGRGRRGRRLEGDSN